MSAFASLLVHGSALCVFALVLVSAGQPVFSEDAWWHLAMGAAYLENGPWLAADPLLHTASVAPAPAAWLFATSLATIERAFGFNGLRLAHVLLVALSSVLCWGLLRRTSGSHLRASLGTAVFLSLAAYRLFQLRPHLFSIAAAIAVVWLLVEPRDGPTRLRIALAAVLSALWANTHAVFLLGPVLVGAAMAGVAAFALHSEAGFSAAAPRLRRMGLGLAALLVASFVNPEGAGPHTLYFVAGDETPELSLVVDEWASMGLLRLPVAGRPPSWLTWMLAWVGLGVVAWSTVLALRGDARTRRLDPAWLGVAAAGMVGMIVAVRFAWLGVFAALVAGQLSPVSAERGVEPVPLRKRLAAPLAAVAIAVAFWLVGPWPSISKGAALATYARPYSAVKYYAHAVWFLRDAGLEGRLYNDYSRGNFLGYWLAPRMRVFVNGSLNLPREAMAASTAIAQRSGDGESGFLELLDRYEVDVFFGTGIAEVTPAARRSMSTTTHLERTPGWIPIFRNVRSGVYLRDAPRNRENLARVEAWYEAQDVPFEAASGFDPERVLREAPDWAARWALVPTHLAHLEAAANASEPSIRDRGRAQLASVFTALGLYDRAARHDRRLVASRLFERPAARRLLWSALHEGCGAEALAAADRLESLADGDPLSALLVDTARACDGLDDSESRRFVASVALFTPSEAHRLFSGFREPEARLPSH